MISLTNSMVGIHVWVLVLLLTMLSQLNIFAQNLVPASPTVHTTTAFAGRRGRGRTSFSSNFRCPCIILIFTICKQKCGKGEGQLSYSLSYLLTDCWKIPVSSLSFLEISSEVFQQTSLSSFPFAGKDEEAPSGSASQATSALVFPVVSLLRQARLVCLI